MDEPLRRRAMLAAFAAGFATLAGCLDGLPGTRDRADVAEPGEEDRDDAGPAERDAREAVAVQSVTGVVADDALETVVAAVGPIEGADSVDLEWATVEVAVNGGEVVQLVHESRASEPVYTLDSLGDTDDHVLEPNDPGVEIGVSFGADGTVPDLQPLEPGTELHLGVVSPDGRDTRLEVTVPAELPASGESVTLWD